MMKLLASTALSIVLGTVALSPALAQSAYPAVPMVGMLGGGCPTMAMMGPERLGRGMMARQARMRAMVAGRLAYLEKELDITEAQSQAWKAYADAVNSRVEAMQGMRQNIMRAMQQGSAVERMDTRIKSMETMLEAMKTVKPATERLYSDLTDEQKRIADALIGMDCGGM
jgi:hypothetical protein